MKAKVLWADDEFGSAPWLAYLGQEFEKADVSVVRAMDSDQAWEKMLSESPFDFVILDGAMPPGKVLEGEDTHNGLIAGLKLARKVRNRNPELPIVIVTNLDKKDVAEAVDDLGNIYVHSKPSERPRDLLKRILLVLRRSGAPLDSTLSAKTSSPGVPNLSGDPGTPSDSLAPAGDALPQGQTVLQQIIRGRIVERTTESVTIEYDADGGCEIRELPLSAFGAEASLLERGREVQVDSRLRVIRVTPPLTPEQIKQWEESYPSDTDTYTTKGEHWGEKWPENEASGKD